MTHTTTRLKRSLMLIGVIAALALGLTACAPDTAGSEVGVDVADLQDAFNERFDAFDGRLVALEGRITAFEDDVAAAAPEANDIPLSEAFGAPDQFVGETVTVSSEVEEILSDMAFTISGPQGPLLITSADGDSGEIVELDEPVEVTGVVHDQFVIAEYEDEYGVDLDDGLFTDYEEQTYITAENITEIESADR